MTQNEPPNINAAEFESIDYQIDKDGEVRSKLEGIRDNHCFVGDTLIWTDHGNVCIKDIKCGDMVLTRMGYKPVSKVHNNGIKATKSIFFLMATA